MSFGYHLDGGFQFNEEHDLDPGVRRALRRRRRRARAAHGPAHRRPGADRDRRLARRPGASRDGDEVFATRHTKAFFAWTLALEAFSIAVFCATDVFLFYVVFEATLIPAYFLIGGFGGNKRRRPR